MADHNRELQAMQLKRQRQVDEIETARQRDYEFGLLREEFLFLSDQASREIIGAAAACLFTAKPRNQRVSEFKCTPESPTSGLTRVQ